MADTIDSKVLIDGPRDVAIRRTCVSDGTGETDAVFIDISTLSAQNYIGKTPVSLCVDRIEYDVQGFSSARLEFDAAADDELAMLGPGFGALDWTGVGGVPDPKSSGFTGDILITTAGAAADATYTITIFAHKKY